MILLAGTPPAVMKRASTKWTTVAKAPRAERGRARAVFRARRISHTVSSSRLQSAPKACQIEAAVKEHLAPLPGAGFRAPRVASRQERAMNPVEIAAVDGAESVLGGSHGD